MAIDRKYGRVTLERGSVGEDEPVVVFRARDLLLPQLLGVYRAMCEQRGSPERHLELISSTLEDVRLWQWSHEARLPVSDPATLTTTGEPVQAGNAVCGTCGDDTCETCGATLVEVPGAEGVSPEDDASCSTLLCPKCDLAGEA